MKSPAALRIPIDRALVDPKLLGAALGDLATWQTWITVLVAAFGGVLDRGQRRMFAAVAGSRKPPKRPVRELWCIVGRRGGKSRIAAALGVFAASFLPRRLAAGEVGEVAIVAASREQANIVFQYVLGFLESSPVLRQEIETVTRTEVRLRGNVVLAVRAGNFRTVRGRTLLCAVLDEVAFLRDDTSANPDVELYRAILPAFATTGGMLIGISTPYRRSGLLYQKHRDHFGVNDDDVLVVNGPSKMFNCTLDKKTIARAVASDPEAARAEWEGEFRSDIAAFLDDDTIDRAIDHDRPLELPPQSSNRYVAFCDVSGGRHDAYTICIAHRSGNGIVADVVRGARAPFDPQIVTREYAQLLKAYHVREVISDDYGCEWVAGEFRSCGIIHKRCEYSKSELYLESLPWFMRGAVRIPDHKGLARELRLLERHTSRVGRDMVDAPRGISEDHANALAGAIVSIMTTKGPIIIPKKLLERVSQMKRRPYGEHGFPIGPHGYPWF
jgi:hypothetical protein